MRRVLFCLALWACDIPLQGTVAPGSVGDMPSWPEAMPTDTEAEPDGTIKTGPAPEVVDRDQLESDPCWYCEASNLGPVVELRVVPCRADDRDGIAEDGTCYLRTRNHDCTIACAYSDGPNHTCELLADIKCVRRGL